MAGTLRVSKLTARESRIAFEKSIQVPLLTGLVVFDNRYMFYADFRPLSTDRAKNITSNRLFEANDAPLLISTCVPRLAPPKENSQLSLAL